MRGLTSRLRWVAEVIERLGTLPVRLLMTGWSRAAEVLRYWTEIPFDA